MERAGAVYTVTGAPMRTVDADYSSSGRRYRYYISRPDHEQHVEGPASASTWRLPARDLERCVTDCVALIVKDRAAVASAALTTGMEANGIDGLLQKIERTSSDEYLGWVRRVDLGAYELFLSITLPGPTPISIQKTIPMTLKRRGHERRMVIENMAQPTGRRDPTIIKTIGHGLEFWERLREGKVSSVMELAKAKMLDNRYAGRAMTLAFLAPDIVEMFLSGQQPPEWTAERLMRRESLSFSWVEQRKIFGLC